MKALTHGSLFSGIGGFDLGFERAGIKTIWQVEIDGYCRRVLARHFPDAQRFSDIRECGGRNLPTVDILSGGFPCQDISNAGKRAGIDGERSGLWSEYARIIRELRPRYVVVENVAALLGRGMERVLGDLAACGYDAEWQSIRARDVGAPHQRERIWIVAYPQCSGRRESPSYLSVIQESLCSPKRKKGSSIARPSGKAAMSDSDSSGRGRSDCSNEVNRSTVPRRRNALNDSGAMGPKVSDDDRERFAQFQGQCAAAWPPGTTIPYADPWWETEPDVGRVADGIPNVVDRLRGIGNAIVPQIAEWIGRRIVSASQATIRETK